MARRKITPFGRLFIVLAITGGLYFGYTKVQEAGGFENLFNSDTTKNIGKISAKSPGKIVEGIFEAARNEDFSKLAEFCPLNGSSSDEVKDICFMDTATEEERADFINNFKFGQVIGKPVVAGDEARVQIKWGPNGAKNGTISLVKADGNWYLSDLNL